MRAVLWVVIIIIMLPSCFLLRDHKRRQFSYMRAGDRTPSIVAIIVPKGFKREEKVVDSLGHQGVVYHYLGGATFYVQYAPLEEHYPTFDTSMHIPEPHLQGGIFYKGIDSTKRWWREAQPPSFRIGYRNVSTEDEVRFDSAVNYVKPGVSSHRRRK